MTSTPFAMTKYNLSFYAFTVLTRPAGNRLYTITIYELPWFGLPTADWYSCRQFRFHTLFRTTNDEATSRRWFTSARERPVLLTRSPAEWFSKDFKVLKLAGKKKRKKKEKIQKNMLFLSSTAPFFTVERILGCRSKFSTLSDPAEEAESMRRGYIFKIRAAFAAVTCPCK